MSLLPFLFNDSSILPPIKILDQYFAVVLKPEDLQQPETVSRLLHRSPTGYLRPWRPAAAKGDLGSTISFDEEIYRAILDVQQFGPEELSVTATGNNTVIVEGKHGEKEDDQGKIQRQFVRRYILPKNCDMDKVESKLSSDGILTITAPRTGENPVDQKNILIIQTGEPGREIEQVVEKCENEPEKKCEKSPEKKCEKPPEKKCEKPPEKKCEKPPEKKCEKPSEKKCEKPSEKKCEKPPEKKCEKPSGKKCEKPPEKKCEKPSEKKYEKPLEKKSEKPSGKKM